MDNFTVLKKPKKCYLKRAAFKHFYYLRNPSLVVYFLCRSWPLFQLLYTPLLNNAGTVSHKQAVEKATQEFEEYHRKEMLQYESDFDRAVKELKSQKR